jgi:hypothetical protein
MNKVLSRYALFGILGSVEGRFITDVSGQPNGPTLKGEESKKNFYLECLALDGRADRLSRNVGKKLPFYAA